MLLNFPNTLLLKLVLYPEFLALIGRILFKGMSLNILVLISQKTLIESSSRYPRRLTQRTGCSEFISNKENQEQVQGH